MSYNCCICGRKLPGNGNSCFTYLGHVIAGNDGYYKHFLKEQHNRKEK